MPYADVAPVKMPDGLSDEHVLFLGDIFPTDSQAAAQCEIETTDTVSIWGCGPVGQFAIRAALLLGAEQVIAIDKVPERLTMAEAERQDSVARDPLKRCRRLKHPKRLSLVDAAVDPAACLPEHRALVRSEWHRLFLVDLAVSVQAARKLQSIAHYQDALQPKATDERAQDLAAASVRHHRGIRSFADSAAGLASIGALVRKCSWIVLNPKSHGVDSIHRILWIVAPPDRHRKMWPRLAIVAVRTIYLGSGSAIFPGVAGRSWTNGEAYSGYGNFRG